MLSVEVKDLLEADGAIFEAPVSSALLTVAHVVQDSCRNNGIAFTSVTSEPSCTDFYVV